MHTRLMNMKILSRHGLLYPMLVIAAVSVIIFSALGVATMTGWLPRAESTATSPPHAEATGAGATAAASPPATMPRREAMGDARSTSRARTRVAANGRDAACADCGVVESINQVEVKGSGSGLGMVAGGLTGALLGNQIGRGNGNAVATIAGAAGGAFAGNEIEKNMKKGVRYQVRVRMDDGTNRTTYQSSAPAVAVGDKVRIVNGQVVARG